jgi:hypothetical protein
MSSVSVPYDCDIKTIVLETRTRRSFIYMLIVGIFLVPYGYHMVGDK